MKNLSFLLMILAFNSYSFSQPTIEWQKSFGGSGQDWAFSIQQTKDGGYIVVGVSGSEDGDINKNHGGGDYWVVKLNSLGNIDWEKSLGGSGYEQAHSISQTSDSGYIVAGWSYSNDCDVTGHHGSTDSSDYWIVKLSPDITDVQDKNNINNSSRITNISPNPTNSRAIIDYYLNEPVSVSLTLQSILGENIIQIENNIYKDAGSYSVELNTSDLPSGVYFCTLKAGNDISTAKVMVIK